MFCPTCGSRNVTPLKWETCLDCGCTFKVLNRGDTKSLFKRGKKDTGQTELAFTHGTGDSPC